jgi:MFS transporter, PPP family, 3-phenylpropionic acid transporter
MFKTSPFGWVSQYYFSFFFAYGAYLPFWALWLKSQGVSSANIGIVLGLAFATRCVANIVITPRIHRVDHYIPALRWFSLLCVVLFAAHGVTQGNFISIIFATIALNLCFGPITPISDALTNYYTNLNQLDYGRTRLWGSVAFIVGSLIVGWIVAHLGESWILYMSILGMAATYLLSLRLPHTPPVTLDEKEAAPRAKLTEMLREWPVVKFLLLISFIQGSHAAYYGFSSVYWQSVGYAENVIGYLWSLGVIAEIAMFALSRRFFRGWSIRAMFMLAAVAVIVRWGLTAMTFQLSALVVVQLLHGMTFAVAHLAAIRYIQQASAERMIALQALYNAIPMGAVIALMTTLCGWGYESWGVQIFWGMAVMGLFAIFIRLDPQQPSLATHSIDTASST